LAKSSALWREYDSAQRCGTFALFQQDGITENEETRPGGQPTPERIPKTLYFQAFLQILDARTCVKVHERIWNMCQPWHKSDTASFALRSPLTWRGGMRKKPDAAEATPGQVTFGEYKQPLSGPNIAGHGLPAIHEAKKAKLGKSKLAREVWLPEMDLAFGKLWPGYRIILPILVAKYTNVE